MSQNNNTTMDDHDLGDGRSPKNKKYKGKGNNKRRNPKPKDIPDENNWKFYAASEEIAKDVASVPFNYLGGTPFNIKGMIGDAVAGKGDAIPCVMNIEYINSIGVTNSRTQGVNMAATQLYTYIRHVNSGAKNYEAADVMMYILALREIWSEFFELKKVIGMASLYNYYNHNLPDALITAEHIDANDLRSNLAQYRGRLNILAKKINSFAAPKYFKIFDRAAYISSFIFGDSDSVRGQFYNFRKAGYYTWSGTASEQGTSLVFHKHNIEPNNLETLSDRFTILEGMLDALFLDEDAITMSGDILKAFKDNSDLLQIAQTDEQYVISFLHDEDILAQIENSKAVLPLSGTDSLASDTYSFDITQNNQIITFNPYIVTGQVGVSSQLPVPYDLILNSHKSNPDYRDVLEWTRLMTISSVTYPDGGGAKLTIESSGLEIVLGYRMYRYTSSGEIYELSLGYAIFPEYYPRNLQTMIFDWHPFQYFNNDGKIEAFGDFKVATLVSSETINKINDAAIYGALYGSMLYNTKD